jgi:hypothetical protein
MNQYGSIADDFYVNMHLQTAMELPQQRDALLHFFEQVQRRFPEMRNFTCRDRETFLDEDKESGTYRWASCEAKRISSGMVNPSSYDEAFQLHKEVLGIVPFALSLSHLDCEYLSVVMGFDFTYRGNQSQLIAEAIGFPPAFEGMSAIPGAKCIGYDPSIMFALDDEMRTQCRISFESRVTELPSAKNEFPEEQLSAFLAVRRTESLGPNEKFHIEFERLALIGKEILDSYMIEHILQPLRDVIVVN